MSINVAKTFITLLTLCALLLLGACFFAVVRGDFISHDVLSFFSQVCAVVVILSSLRILVSMAGIISFGHALYVGAGGYAAAYVMLWLESNGSHAPLFFIPLIGGVAGLAVAVVAGWISTRRKHAIYTTMVTLALAELVHVIAQSWGSVFGGEAGLQIDRSFGQFLSINFVDERWMLLLSLSYAVFALLFMVFFAKRALGILLVAVREDAERVACLGISPQRVKYHAFLISGFMAGIGGALLVLEFEMADSSLFSMENSAYYLVFTCLGGLGSSLGSVLGGGLQVFSQTRLPLMTDYPELWVGVAIVISTLFLPQGGVTIFHVVAIKVRQGWQALSYSSKRQ